MINFSYQNTTKIIFGKGTESQVGDEVKKFGSRVLLHYGGGSIKKSGLYDKVIKSLKDADLEVFELGGVKPNPRLSLVKEGIKICRENNIDFILAVGGGSVIDSSKAIGIGVHYEGDVWDFYTGKAKVSSTLPVGVILTLPAAGSESSTSSVITNEDGWYKRSVGDNLIRPVFAIMNPELTYTLPPYQTAAGAADMMAHIFERYFTNEPNVDLTDRLSEGTLKTIIKNVPIVLQNPKNYEARAEIMWAGTIAHNGLLGTGRVEDWATHDIEHEISGIYDITHGAGLAILFPAWMKYVYKKDVKKFAQFANRVWNVEIDVNDLEKTALEGIEKTKAYFKEIGMPVSLREANIPDDKFEEMAKKATENGPLGNFVKLNKEDIIAIFNLAK
ncbi:iron-containing alcohol dehydrogenase [Clostridium sp.]|jgi:alcohol dehydrogenase|uniref:iron-containing alcohol dehydrogenase n=1 Tax=Clostridium sp. TaxID=1506 RepID=UPI0039F62FCA